MARIRARYHVFGLCLVGLIGAYSSSVVAEENTSLPRYRLEVGQQLTYKTSDEFKYKNSDEFTHAGGPKEASMGGHGDATLWVVRKNADGSFRVVIRTSNQMVFDGKDQGGVRHNVAYFDVFPDGRVIPNPSLGHEVHADTYFPRLPADQKELKEGWQGMTTNGESHLTYKLVSQPKGAPGAWTFEYEQKSPLDEIYLMTHNSTVKFDPARGFVEDVERADTQGYGFNGKGTDSTKLASIEKHDADWSKQLAGQSERYFQAKQAYEQKTNEAEKTPDVKRTEKILKEAKAILTEVQPQIKDPIVKGLLADEIKHHDSMKSYYTQSAALRAKVLGKKAAEFEAKDLRGKTHTLKDFHGKVVVFDFWYRGCGWCMRAMPQVRQLAAEFRGQPVAVVGMNTDRKDADAKFVVDKMKLDYLTLRIDFDLAEKYGVRGFPTMVILDREGKVHDLHVGYSPTLQQEVGEVVRQLLAKK